MVDLAGSGRLRAIAGITLLGLALRIAGLGQSLYGDELHTYRALVDQGLGDALRTVHRTEDTPPLFFVLAWAAAKAGDPTLWLRMPSLVLGTAAIPLTYLIGLRTVGRTGALIGAALFALAPFAVFYAGEARAYATLVFFVALSTLALLCVVDGGGRRWWLVLAVAAAAALMTHYTALFVVAAQAGWALWRAPALRGQLLAAHALAALPLALLLVSGTEASVGEISALFPLTADTVAGQTARALAGLPFQPLRDVPGVPGAMLVAIAVLAVAARALAQPAWRSPDAGVVLLAALALAAPAGVLLYSALESSIFLARNLSASLPGAALLAGAAVAAAGSWRTPVAAAALLAALAYGSALALAPATRRPPFDAAARFIDASARPGDAIVQLDPFPVDYPAGQDPLLDSLRIYLEEPERARRLTLDDRAVWADAARSPRVYVSLGQVTGLEGVPPEPRLPVAMRLVESRSWEGFAPVAVFVFEPR